MSGYRRASDGVIRWPDSPDAQRALEEWFADASTTAYLCGDLLDFRGADLSGLDVAGANLANSHLVGVRFEEANLGDANLTNADLEEPLWSALRQALAATTLRCSQSARKSIPTKPDTACGLPELHAGASRATSCVSRTTRDHAAECPIGLDQLHQACTMRWIHAGLSLGPQYRSWRIMNGGKPQRPDAARRSLLRLLLSGVTIEIAARELHISTRTAEGYLSEMRNLTGTRNLYSLGAFAERNGWHLDSPLTAGEGLSP
ncbi:pentapeptide repeat-containing protein [Micromonospora sp. NPDC005205]|uniref:pentapeptide repeat-containing protein n=1 Tax=Micromonospora sp. NPDC005205 TaxID=3156714 RepID=UPI0033B12E57